MPDEHPHPQAPNTGYIATVAMAGHVTVAFHEMFHKLSLVFPVLLLLFMTSWKVKPTSLVALTIGDTTKCNSGSI